MSSSPNTQVRPVTYTEDPASGMAAIGGLSVQTLAETYGTPLYILDEATLRQTIHAYKDAFKAYPAPFKVLFAGKANLNMGLCALAKSEGLGVDVVSGGEFYTVMKSGFPAADAVFNGNNKTPDELTLAIANGIGRISVDNADELELIHRIAGELGKKVPVILRVTPGIECHTHDYIKTGQWDSKFGFPLSQLPGVVDKIVSDYAATIDLTGLHAHIGSQIFETQPYSDLIDVLLNCFVEIRERHGLTLTHLNLGGGLGIAYQSEDDPPTIQEYANTIVTKLVAAAAERDFPLPVLFLEPGRSLIATSGATLYTVGSIKHLTEVDKTYVAVDGGMGDNIRPALYGAVYSALVANKCNQPHDKPVTIAGKYCESGDILIQRLSVPSSVSAGDYLLVFGTGAYNYAMSSNYNRVPRPAMVIVNEGKAEVLVKRETYDTLLAQDLIPDAWR